MSTLPGSRGASTRTPRWLFAVGAFVLVGLSSILFYAIITGRTRNSGPSQPLGEGQPSTTTIGIVGMSPRHLDGVLVPNGQESLPVRAVMIDNQIDARPWSGLSLAQLVIEAPVEGGITRLMAFYDASSTVAMIGPVRSARPYFIDWAEAWQALYVHVGGSNEALEKIRTMGRSFVDLNEMTTSGFFWRSKTRLSPHATYTNSVMLADAALRRGATSTTPITWRFQDTVTSTEVAVKRIVIPYGGSYTIFWSYDPSTGRYTRMQGTRLQREAEGGMIEASNIVVIKTEQQVLDSAGRLKVRTVGSGEALLYRNGQKHEIRWRRSAHESMRFEGIDGTDVLLNRGVTWIQVITDDKIFAGVN